MSSDSRIGAFATTQWSDVRRAATLQGDASEALEQLCRRYWYPLYAYLRRAGHDSHAAQDHVQSFFADLLSRETLRRADPERGRFRTFLLTSCRNHVANIERAQAAHRRGGGRRKFSLDTGQAEIRYAVEPTERWTAERLFDRRWALAVIESAFHRVKAEYEAKGRGDRFEALKPLVTPTDPTPTHAEVAQSLGCSAGSVKVAAHRLRQQFGQALRDEIARTVDVNAFPEAEKEIDDELNLLLDALRGPPGA